MTKQASAIIQDVLRLRAEAELLFEDAVKTLEVVAAKWVVEHVKPCETMSPHAREVREALNALDMAREART